MDMNHKRVLVIFIVIVVFVLPVACGTVAGQSGLSLSATVHEGGETEEDPLGAGSVDRINFVTAEGIETGGLSDFVQIDGTPSKNPLWEFGWRYNKVSPSSPLPRAFDSGSSGLVIDPVTEQQVNSEELNESMDNIDSVLVQLIESPNKKEFAERNGIDYRNGRVQVVIEMERNSTIPESYNLTEELNYVGQGKNLTQAYVPVGSIASLSDEKGVVRVRLPLRGVPSRETEKEHREQTENENNSGDSNRNLESPESTGSQGTQQEDEKEDQKDGNDRDEEGLGSVLGSVVPAMIVILTAAYSRRKL